MRKGILAWVFLFQVLSLRSSEAGTFTLPHFVTVGEFAVGVEPEVVFSNGASMGINIRYTHGVSDLNNLLVFLGTGSGNRGFRAGGAFTFDFFPDIERQPGIGLALQGLYVQIPSAPTAEITAIPYIHKSFQTDVIGFEPFLSVPVGLALANGNYQVMTTISVGSLFQHSEHIRSVLEFGVGISNAYTYISAGVTYYH